MSGWRHDNPLSPRFGFIDFPETAQLPLITEAVAHSETSSLETPSTTVRSIIDSLQFRPTPDPLDLPVRPATRGFLDAMDKETARLLVQCGARKPASTRRFDIGAQLDEVARYADRWYNNIGGWLDNAARRESNQSDAIRSGSMIFESKTDFQRRLARPGKDSVFADLTGEEGPEEGFENDAPEGLEDDNEEEDTFDELKTGGNSTAAESLASHPKPPEVDAHQKRMDKQIQKGLEMIQAGAQVALQPSDVSTTHAIAQDYSVPEVEREGNIRLLRHQRDGTGRMLHLEETQNAWVNADDTGLGKTIQAISLITMDKLNNPDGISICVVPKQLLGYWQAEFKRHAPSLKVLLFHGPEAKKTTRSQILEYDVVLTSYETLVSQWTPFATAEEDWPLIRFGEREKEVKVKKRSGRRAAARGGEQPKTKMQRLNDNRADSPLYSIKFRRILIDEGHRIKNVDTLVSQAVAAIDAEKRGCITGTPLQNDYGDFFAIARFLHLSPWDNRDLFQACFIKKAKDENSSAAKELDRNMAHALGCLRSLVTIRRLKGQMFDGESIAGVREPAKSDLLVNLGPSNQQYQDPKRDMWDAAYRAVLKENSENHRQPCLPKRSEIFVDLAEGQLQAIHPILTTATYGDLGAEDDDTAIRDRDTNDEDNSTRTSIPERSELLERYQKASKEEQMKSAQATRREFIERMKRSERDEESECIKKAIGRIVRILEEEKERLKSFSGVERKEEASRGKVLVFSNSLGGNDLVGVGLWRRGIPYYELNGHCSDSDRDETLRQFEELGLDNKPKDFTKDHVQPDEVRVLLASMRVAAEGFNMVHASHVILLGPGWNPFVRIQAISRAYRIGQLRQVQIYDIWADKSMHVRVRRVQAVKLRKVGSVMEDSGKFREGAREIRNWDLSTFKGYVSILWMANLNTGLTLSTDGGQKCAG